MKNTFLSVLLILCFLGSQAQTTLDTAVNFNVKDISGNTYHLFDLLDSNKYVLLDFFTTSCGPCVTYAPDIQQAYQDFGSNQLNVFFLGINYGDNNNGVAAFDSLYGITFPTASGLDGHGNTVSLDFYNIQSWPTMVLIAPNRLILNHQIFPPSISNLDSTIAASTGIGVSSWSPSMNDQSFQAWGLFPNPVEREAFLRIFMPSPGLLSYDVVTVSGSLVIGKKNVVLNEGYHVLGIPVASLEAGMYFVRLNLGPETLAVLKFLHR